MQETSDNPMAYIGEKWESIYDALCKGGGVFDQMSSLFTLCVAIGHSNDSPQKPAKKKGIFRWANLSSRTDVPILIAVAWDASDRNLSVLTDKRQIMEIVCDYAEGGMQYLHDNFFEDHMQDDQLLRPEKLDIEFNLAQIVEGLRQQQSLF